MLAAIGHPPHLAGIFPYVTGSNYHGNWIYQGGAFEQWLSESWSSKLARETFNQANQKRVDPLNGAPTLPLADYPIFGLQQLPSQATTTKAFRRISWIGSIIPATMTIGSPSPFRIIFPTSPFRLYTLPRGTTFFWPDHSEIT